MNKTKIEWTEKTWNPITGCSKLSLGCENCYAEKMAKRLHAMKNPRYINAFSVTMHFDLVEQPLKYKKNSIIFVCSMSDLFHEDVADEFIVKIFETMNKASWHIFQVLTKRPERLRAMCNKLVFTDNIWVGTSVESMDVSKRVDSIREIPAKIKFLSCEPLLGSLRSLNLDNINWVVVGGESGARARPMEIEWVREIRDKCEKNEISFFFKQWGGWNKKKNGRELDGEIYNEIPNHK